MSAVMGALGFVNPVALTTTGDTNPVFSKGMLVYLDGTWHKYVLNDEASTAFADGDCVVLEDNVANGQYANYVFASTGATFSRGYPCGFAQSALAAQKYGFIKTGGNVPNVTSTGTINRGDLVKISTTNKKVDAATEGTHHPIGVAQTAAASNLVDLWLYFQS